MMLAAKFAQVLVSGRSLREQGASRLEIGEHREFNGRQLTKLEIRTDFAKPQKGPRVEVAFDRLLALAFRRSRGIMR